MRENGVRALSIACLDCSHAADVNVDSYPGHLAVQSVRPSNEVQRVRQPEHQPNAGVAHQAGVRFAHLAGPAVL